MSSKFDNMKYVVVTGFGPFRDHQLNPSWEAIKDGRLGIDKPNIKIITREISVSYNEVDNVVKELWESYSPILMVHVGLADFETSIRIEQIARHGPYIHDDICREAPHKDLRQYNEESLEEQSIRHNYSCKPCQFSCSKTIFDVGKICAKLNNLNKSGHINIPFKPSDNAGLYVCEYIYQKSLSICNRSVFIHVPNVEKFRLEDISVALKYTIETLIDETNDISS